MGVSIFLDESGDQGWEFDAPYGGGGSSRYLTLAAVMVDDRETVKLSRIVRGFYKDRKRPLANELKSHHLSSKERQEFCRRAVALSQNIPSLRLFAITVRKENVHESFRRHPNGLYNYMVKLLLLDEMAKQAHVNFIPDARDVKTELRLALDDYLKTELAIRQTSTTLQTTPWESHAHLDLQFADYLAGCVWSCFEFNNQRYFNLLEPVLQSRTLFFQTSDR